MKIIPRRPNPPKTKKGWLKASLVGLALLAASLLGMIDVDITSLLPFV